MTARTAARRGFAVATLGCVLLGASPASAQAFLPPKGTAQVSMLFQSVTMRDHMLSDGGRTDPGPIDARSVLFDFTYSLTDRIALAISVPYVGSRFDGSHAPPAALHPGSLVDDGAWHSTMQDFRLGLRRGYLRGASGGDAVRGAHRPLPSIYLLGHAAIGRRIGELQAGVDVARALPQLVPGGPLIFVQARYSYGFAQRAPGLNVDHDRSNGELEVGAVVKNRLRVFAPSSGEYTHGGQAVQLTRDFPGDLNDEEFHHHDQSLLATRIDVGIGAQFTLSSRLELYGSITTTIAGRNGHSVDHAVSVGLSTTFSKAGQSAARGPAPSDPSSSNKTLAKCLCQKGR